MGVFLLRLVATNLKRLPSAQQETDNVESYGKRLSKNKVEKRWHALNKQRIAYSQLRESFANESHYFC